jgi:glycosyltransferase involved in cell wall biosynthesis
MNTGKVPISILIATRNEIKNINNCLLPIIEWADEIVIVDSQSTDGTIEHCKKYNLNVVQFYYNGGWPKKRQWMLDNYEFKNNWILLLDVDEILLPAIKLEIELAISNENINGYWIDFQMIFLGRQLKYGGANVWKLFLFRNGFGKYEMRVQNQNKNMSDIEVHEHIIVTGNVSYLKNPVRHENFNSLFRYIEKHNEYSDWEAKLFYDGSSGEIKPSIFGNQAQKRRWLKKTFMHVPGSPYIYFLYNYIFKLGILDGIPGFIFAALQGIQLFHVKMKIFELKSNNYWKKKRN